MKQSPSQVALEALLLAAIALAAAAWFGWNCLAAASSQGWPKASGTMLDSEVDYVSTSKGGYYDIVVRYEYEVNGQTHNSKRFRYGGNFEFNDETSLEQKLQPFPPGGRVEVYYDPADPAQSVLDPSIPGGDLFASLLALFVAFCFLVVALYSRQVARWFNSFGSHPVMNTP